MILLTSRVTAECYYRIRKSELKQLFTRNIGEASCVKFEWNLVMINRITPHNSRRVSQPKARALGIAAAVKQ